MKMTLDLPSDLVKAVKLRALHDGKKLKDAAADLLRRGLEAQAMPGTSGLRPSIGSDPQTGLPVVECAPGAPIEVMSAEDIYALIERTHEEEDLERYGASLRR